MEENRCGDCGTELSQTDKQCPNCNSTRKAYGRGCIVGIGVTASGKTAHKRMGNGTLMETISNWWKRSGDPKLANGVREDRTINKQKDEYYQVVRDAKTGKVIHEEHLPLSEHNRQSKAREDRRKD